LKPCNLLVKCFPIWKWHVQRWFVNFSVSCRCCTWHIYVTEICIVTTVVSQEHCIVTGHLCGFELVCRLGLVNQSAVTSGWGHIKWWECISLLPVILWYFKLFQVKLFCTLHAQITIYLHVVKFCTSWAKELPGTCFFSFNHLPIKYWAIEKHDMLNPNYATCDIGNNALVWRRYQVEEKHCTPCFGYNVPH